MSASEVTSESAGAASASASADEDEEIWASGDSGQRLSRTTLSPTLLYAQSGGAMALHKTPKSIQKRISELRTSLAQELENYEGLKHFEAATGIRKIDAVSWAGLAVAISLWMGWGARQWCELISFAYPAQSSIKTLVTKDKAQVIRWVTYWVCMSFLNLIELAFGYSLLHIAPFYYPLKIGLALWLQSRTKRGALYVHSHVLAPFLKCHEAVPFQQVIGAAQPPLQGASK